MGRRGYPAEFRRRVLDLVAGGCSVADVARDLQISDQTIYLAPPGAHRPRLGIGQRNKLLRKRLRRRVSVWPVHTSDERVVVELS